MRMYLVCLMPLACLVGIGLGMLYCGITDRRKEKKTDLSIARDFVNPEVDE